MKEQKETFIFYTNWVDYINLLEPSDVKTLISIICDYVKNLTEPKKPNLSDRLLMTWLFIKSQLDKDKTKYDRRCETSKINGQKGGRPKNLNNLKKPKKADNEYEYDNEYEHDSDNDLVVLVDIYTFIENNFGRTLSPIEYEQIALWEDSELTRYAIKQAVLNGVYSIKYISRILENFERNNIQTVQQAQIEEQKFKNKTQVDKPEWVDKTYEEEPASDEEIKNLEERLKGR